MAQFWSFVQPPGVPNAVNFQGGIGPVSGQPTRTVASRDVVFQMAPGWQIDSRQLAELVVLKAIHRPIWKPDLQRNRGIVGKGRVRGIERGRIAKEILGSRRRGTIAIDVTQRRIIHPNRTRGTDSSVGNHVAWECVSRDLLYVARGGCRVCICYRD